MKNPVHASEFLNKRGWNFFVISVNVCVSEPLPPVLEEVYHNVSAITLGWQPRSPPRGLITEFMISMENGQKQRAGGQEREIVFAGLTAGTQYKFRVSDVLSMDFFRIPILNYELCLQFS